MTNGVLFLALSVLAAFLLAGCAGGGGGGGYGDNNTVTGTAGGGASPGPEAILVFGAIATGIGWLLKRRRRGST